MVPASVVVRRVTGRTRVTGFPSWEAIQTFVKEVKQECPNFELHVVSNTKPIYPEFRAKPPHPGMLWCPYCGEWRYWYKWYDYKKCKVCGISDADFYVRKINHLFPSPRPNGNGKKRRRS